MLPTLGVDISKDSFHLELLVNEKLRHRKFANRTEGFAELCVWLAKHKTTQVHACLEATGAYGEDLALYLHQQGHTVSIVNPVQIKAFGQSELLRNKDDRPDAGLIRRYCEERRREAWTPPAPELRELQALTRHVDSLIETRQQQLNRLEGVKNKGVLKSLRKLVAYLDAEIARTEKQIQEHIDQHPELKQQTQLLESIPGIGKKTVCCFALLGDPCTAVARSTGFAFIAPRFPGAHAPDTVLKVKRQFWVKVHDLGQISCRI